MDFPTKNVFKLSLNSILMSVGQTFTLVNNADKLLKPIPAAVINSSFLKNDIF